MGAMRKSGSWQTVWDDRILETAANDDDGAVSLTGLVEDEHIRISQSSISRRCKTLAEHGLLRKVGPGTYILTDEGEAYLKGEYDANEGVYLNNYSETNGPTATETESNSIP